MARSVLAPVMSCLSRLAGFPAADLSDAELLERYRRGGEESAFALLVQRHGPAVLGVCRRALGESADADDAFQATFLILLSKADSVRPGSALSYWLYGVARRVAGKARARRVRTCPLSYDPATSAGDPVCEASGRELLAVLDEEIGGLPEKYRAALVLCGLGERSCEQAARELGWPKSTVIHRLARARQRLRQRLSRRGIEVPAALLVAVLAREATASHVPALLTLATVRQARQSVAAAAVTPAARLAVRSAVARWGVALALVGALGLAVGAAALRVGAGPQPPKAAPPEKPARVANPAPRTDKEGFPLPAEALARVGSARLRHGWYISLLEYSPDNSLLASFGWGRLRVWEVRTGKLVREFEIPDRESYSNGFFTPDGKSVVVLDGKTLRWFDVRSGNELRHCDVKFPGDQRRAYLSPRRDLCAVLQDTPAGDLVVYELPSGKERFRKTSEKSWMGEPTFSPDGKVLAVVGGTPIKDTRILLFDTEAGQPLGEINSGEAFRNLAFSPDGKAIVACAYPQNLTVWEVPSGKVLHRVKAGISALMRAAFTRDGKSVVVSMRRPSPVRIDVATGKELQRYHTYPGRSQVAVSPDGQTLAIGGERGDITQWDLATGQLRPASAELVGDLPRFQFDEGGKLLWACFADFTAVDWAAGRVVRHIRPPGMQGDPLAVSPDRSRVIDGSEDKKVSVRDVASGKELWSLPLAPDSFMTAPLFSPDGKTVYTARWDGPIQARETETGKELPAVDKWPSFTRSLALSQDGRRLAAADHPRAQNPRREIIVWDPVERREIRRLLPPDDGQAWDLALSADGKHLAAIGSRIGQTPGRMHGFLAVWDLASGEQKLARTGVADNLFSVALSADGRMLATGGGDGAVRLWEVATGQERHHFAGHERVISEVAFSPDGKVVAAASNDAPVFVWDVTGCYDKPPAAGPLPAGEAAALWDGLNDGNAANAFAAMRQLLRRPGAAVALVRDRLKPVAVVDEQTLERLLRDLDADDFATREKAVTALEAVAGRAEGRLRKALAGNLTAEARRRVEHALEAASPPALGRRREVRAVEVLEWIDTAEARQLLAALAGGEEGALLTREARAAVGRMKGR
jgi:RNA polymerase sigma factor (sigma-70 family)